MKATLKKPAYMPNLKPLNPTHAYHIDFDDGRISIQIFLSIMSPFLILKQFTSQASDDIVCVNII